MQYLRARVRAWTTDARTATMKAKPRAFKGRAPKRRKPIEHILVFDTETTPDSSQRLLFGSYLYCYLDKSGELYPIEEGLFYEDGLKEYDPEGFRILTEYAEKGRRWDADAMRYRPVNEFSSRVDSLAAIEAEVPREPNKELRFMSRSEFVKDVLYEVAYPTKLWAKNKPATVVGYNLPFDLSRIAVDVVEARGQYVNGFSFQLLRDKGYSNVRTVKLGAKGTRMGFAGRVTKYDANAVRGNTGLPDDYFTDASTLVWALTNHTYTLKQACEVFNAKYRKSEDQQEFGVISDKHITYCRDDVRATAWLYLELLKEFNKHPIDLRENQAYSPASLAKSYLAAMGVQHPLAKQPDFPAEILGYATSTFYGGRSECHVRRVPVPVEYMDVTSMYPTVNANMRLWDLVIHEKVDVREETAEVQAMLDNITVDELFNPEMWQNFRGIVQLIPDDDLLTIRAPYAENSPSHQISTVYATCDEPMWWTIPDVINAKINGVKTPRIMRAYRFYPGGERLSSLRPVKLRGDIEINPAEGDFFRRIIELRQAVKARRVCGSPKGCMCEDCRLEQFLKVLANSGSYGIFVELNRKESKKAADRLVFGGESVSWNVRLDAPEDPGKFCFPPIGTIITGAARLMLGMVERLVTDAGGTWAICDTDSMAVVASKNGGTIPVDGATNIPVITYEQVEQIRQRFNALNPYDPAVAGNIDILKREWPVKLTDDPVYCYAISAKRYALFVMRDNGPAIVDLVDKDDIESDENEDEFAILDNKEHGLGQYMNPIDPNANDERGGRAWVQDVWQYLIRKDMGTNPPEPEWFKQPAMVKLAVSSWHAYKPYRTWNDGRVYQDQIKPYSFGMTAQTIELFKPAINDPIKQGKRFRPIAPFNSDASQWTELPFWNMYDPEGSTYYIWQPGKSDRPVEQTAAVKLFRTVVDEYRLHPESKFADINGQPCKGNTRGTLYRRHVIISGRDYIGKESNSLDKRQDGVIDDIADVLANYGSGKDDFIALVPPVFKWCSRLEIVQMLSRRNIHVDKATVVRALSGKTAPRAAIRNALIHIAVERAINTFGSKPPSKTWIETNHSPEHIEGAVLIVKAEAYRQWREVLYAWRKQFESKEQ